MPTFPSRSIDAACENRLEAILSEMFPMLRLWLQAVAKAELSVPAEWIPRILENESRCGGALPLVPLVLDEAGREWIAAHRAWRPLVVFEPGERDWTKKKLRARLAHLEMLRATDPAAGLRAIEASWEGQDAEYRRGAIQLLEKGLSAADEDFLERALGERDRYVPGHAASLLSRLPTSRLADRHRARVRQIARSERIEGVVEFVLDEFDPGKATWKKDALAPTMLFGSPPNWTKEDERRSRRESILQALAYAAPLDAWGLATGMSPKEIVRSLRRNVKPPPPPSWVGNTPVYLVLRPTGMDLVLQAILYGAYRERDPEWAEALLAARCRVPGCDSSRCTGLHPDIPALARALPPEERVHLFKMEPEHFAANPTFVEALELFSEPALSKTRVKLFAQVLDDFERWLVHSAGPGFGPPWYGFGEGLAWTTPDDLLDMAMTRVRQRLGKRMNPELRPSVETLAECLTFRIEMLREIREAAG